MASSERDSIRLLKQVIRQKREHMGLPPEGRLHVETVVEALKEQPPMEELVAYVRNALKAPPLFKAPNSLPPTRRKPFDRLA